MQLKHLRTIQAHFNANIEDAKVCQSHVDLIRRLGNNYMGREFRKFDIDGDNHKLLQFLLLYFNNSKAAETVFPDKNYKVHKNLMLLGEPGTGKTLIMQIFADYLKLTSNPNYFRNTSVTEMMNYYKVQSHIDKFTYNISGQSSFDGKPFHVCLNDIGLDTEKQKSYGTLLESVIDEFLFARYEIYQQTFVKYHITSNLTITEFKKRFEDRLVDRFKGFNVIALSGESRRK